MKRIMKQTKKVKRSVKEWPIDGTDLLDSILAVRSELRSLRLHKAEQGRALGAAVEALEQVRVGLKPLLDAVILTLGETGRLALEDEIQGGWTPGTVAPPPVRRRKP